MSTTCEVILFGLERSVYTRIARLALEEKGVAYHLEVVEIFGATGVPSEHLRRHPFGRIPVLQHGELMLYETAAITRYVDEQFAGRALQPADLRARTRMTQIVGILDAYAYRPMVWSVFVERVRKPREGIAPDEALIAQGLAQSRTCLDAIDSLAGGQRYLTGGEPTLADFHAYPMLRYLAFAPEGAALMSEHAELSHWLRRMSIRPSVLRTRGGHELQA